MVDMEGTAYRCKFCQTHLAPADELVSREAAHEKSQKYKGQFALERGRITDGADSEFYLDTHRSMRDAEDA